MVTTVEVADQGTFAFAGVWYPSRDEPCGFALLTCAPGESLAACGADYMPVILRREDHARWLGGELQDPASLLVAYPFRDLRLVSRPR